MNPFFNWLKDSGTQAMLVMVGTVVGITAMIFAGLAAWFAWKAPSKKDLGRVEAHAAATSEKLADVQTHLTDIKKDIKRVEANTSETSEHLESVRSGIASVDRQMKKQGEAGQLQIRANRVSITATGNQSGNAPFELELFVRDSTKELNLVLTHAELYNEHGNSFGSFPCSTVGNPSRLAFHAAIPMATMGEWFSSGNFVPPRNRMRLKLKVWMLLDGVDEVSRDMAVTVRDTNTVGDSMRGYILEGSV